MNSQRISSQLKLDSELTWIVESAAPVSQNACVGILFKPESFHVFLVVPNQVDIFNY